MGYKIEYGADKFCTYTTKKVKTAKFNTKKFLIYTLVIVSIIFCIKAELLIPGDKETTKSAISEFVADVKDGEQVVDAFAVFCRAILKVDQG